MDISATNTKETTMKKFSALILMLILTLSVSTAQSIGDHVNFIKEKKQGGVLKQSETAGIYFYTYQDDLSIWTYVLDENLICRDILMHPFDPKDINLIVEALDNRGYVRIDNTHWKYYRDDGSILGIELVHADNIGPVLTFTQIK